MNKYLYSFSKKVLLIAFVFAVIVCGFIWWQYGFEYALICFVTASIGFFLLWLFFKHVFKENPCEDMSDDDKAAIERVSKEITNSIVACRPFDDETFNRVISDLSLVIIKNKHTIESEFSSQEEKDTAQGKLNDVSAYLNYLRALYVKKPSALKEINQLINKVKYEWKI